MNPRILSHKQKIENIFSKVDTITDISLQGELSKYLCVLSSGFIEQSLRTLLLDYLSKNSSPTIQRYNTPIIKNITNCKHGKIKSILEQFDINWAKEFDDELDNRSQIPDEIKDSINSTVQNRHDIAHGKSIGVGYNTIKKYFDKVKIAVEILEQVIQ